MAGYNEIRGLRVKYLSADPANPEDGQVWYNSTTGSLRVDGIVQAAAWASAANAITAMHAGQGFGGQSDAVGAGGYGPALSPAIVIKQTNIMGLLGVKVETLEVQDTQVKVVEVKLLD